jgi:hypothetical protein
MPLKLNVGLNRKVGEANYGSRGASVNVEMELDGSLVADSAKLQQRIRELFNVCRAAVAEELGNGHPQQPVVQNGNRQQRNNQQSNGSHQATASNPERPRQAANGNKPRLATVSQVRAIRAISNRLRLNLDSLLGNRFRVARPEELSLRDASDLIDELKSEGNA